MRGSLTLTQELHQKLHSHLFPGDGLEAAAILFCSRASGSRLRLLGVDVLPIPHEQCKQRRSDYLQWPGVYLERAIEYAQDARLSIVLVHSHPGGRLEFSEMDDRSDRLTIPALRAAFEQIHASALMIDDGSMLVRVYETDEVSSDLDGVFVVGHQIRWFWSGRKVCRNPLPFSDAMRQDLGSLRIAVVGVSGTGSIVAEQLARLGVGELVVVDPDVVETRNLNRILNSTIEDAALTKRKVDVFARAVVTYRGHGVVQAVCEPIEHEEAIAAVSSCDIVFSCLDNLQARFTVDRICSCMLLPLFDLGVTIPTSGNQAQQFVADVFTRLDYVRPGGPTLEQRGVYSPSTLREEELRQTAKDTYNRELRDGYIKGALVLAPDVISLNMRVAADAVFEFLSRCYEIRHEESARYARTLTSLAACEVEYFCETTFPTNPSPLLARGAQSPLLGLPRYRQARS